MATEFNSDPDLSYDPSYLQEKLVHHYRSLLSQFKKITRSFVLFNVSLISLFILEVIAFLVFFTFFTQSSVLAFSLGGLFLTCFSYFVLLFYFQAKKPDQLMQLKNQFIHSCGRSIALPDGDPEQHLSIAHASMRLVAYFESFEKGYYKSPLRKFQPFFEKLSTYAHWQDVFKIREMLLTAAIDEHIQQIRFTPTDIEVHTSIAGAYVALSKLYLDYQELLEQFPQRSKYKRLHATLGQKFRFAAERAIEEFKILNDYAPNDPWIHSQLATSYHDLQMPEEEIREYETIIKLRPQDKDILFRLGVLYFEQGHNAKGLQVYEELCHANYKKAEHLIAFYGSTNFQDTLEELY